MAHTRTWDAAYEASPADSDNASEGAQEIRELQVDIRERINVDHYMDPAGTDADHGEHRKITFHEPISKPTAVANKAFMYGKDVTAKIELHFLDEEDNEVQLTADGGLYGESIIEGGTIMYFYANTAPTGWTIYNTVEDCVLALKGGSQAYNATGGDGAEKGTWQQPDHTLTVDEIPAHSHTLNTHTNTPGDSLRVVGFAGITDWKADLIGSTGGGSAHNHGTTYRPLAALGILATKDAY